MSETADRAVLIDAAAALLMASITMRDLVSAFSPRAFASMPDDIRGRVIRPSYQGAFDALPHDIREEARALVLADPDVIAARETARRQGAGPVRPDEEPTP